MNFKYLYTIGILIVLVCADMFAQEDSLEIFIIDAYVTPELPHTLGLSFFSSEEVKSKIEIDDRYLIEISDTFAIDHAADINFMNYKFDKKFIPFKILSETKNGKLHTSETFELILPYEEYIETKEGSSPIPQILFGVLLYLLPSPNMIYTESYNNFSLTKELPIITFYSSGYNYPSGNISLEYTHVYDEEIKNYFRTGYKHFIPIRYFEYISPGITGFTNFNSFNGLAAEMSLGFFKIYDVFTVYSRYRFNLNPSNTDQYFHEISIGLYSHFFTIDL